MDLRGTAMKEQHFGGEPVDEERSRVCLLFDPKDGRIVHGHGVTTLHSENRIEPAELEARARERAGSLGKLVEGLKALHLPLAAIRAHSAFRVNASGDGIVPVERARQRGGHSRRP
jgi:hypothetical protein